MEPRSAYVHVPFCRHRCGYCNFTLIAGRDDLIGQYLQALERELSLLGHPRPVDTLYVGGGTPSHLGGYALRELLRILGGWFVLAEQGEFTVEVNPLDLDPAKAEQLAAAGVNRISLGVQSFRREKLRQLERDHEPADVIHAFELARRQFSSVALDLIFAAPDESLSQWQDDLEMAIGLEPDHISTYGLTYDKGSAFWGRRHEGSLQAVDEETERAMYQWAIDRLVAAGFEHYEVSNFARPGHHSRHNQVYWTGASYFAAGPGAARYVGGVREVNHRSTTTYLHRVLAGQSPVAEREQLDSFDRARELLVFGLRRLEGWDAGRFREQTGIGLTELLGPLLHELTQQGLLSWDGDRLKLTREGLMVSDAIWGYVFAPG